MMISIGRILLDNYKFPTINEFKFKNSQMKLVKHWL